MSWVFQPWPAEEAAPAAFVASPIRVTLCDVPPRRHRDVTSRLRPPTEVGDPYPPPVQQSEVYLHPLFPPVLRRRGKALLRKPVVIGAQITFVAAPVHVTLTQRRRGRNIESRLRPPVVVTPKSVARPIDTTLAPSHRKSRRANPRFIYPIVVDRTEALGGTGIQLVQRDRSNRRDAHSRLGKPIISAVTFTATPISVTLVQKRPPHVISRLAPPTVVAPVLARPIDVTLVRIRPVGTQTRLSPPTVVSPFLARPTLVHLAPSSRGVPSSFLRPMGPPAVAYAPITTTLTRIRPAHVIYRLSAPAVVNAHPPEDTTAEINLVRIRPAAVHSILRPPTVVAPVLARPITVTLAPQARGKTNSTLRAPVDLIDRDDLGTVSVTLAPQARRPGVALLRAPVVVAPVLARPIKITLARIKPPRVLSTLRRPATTAAAVAETKLSITLAPSRRGKARSTFVYPIVVNGVEALGGIGVNLVRIRPVAVHSRLGRPAVVAPSTFVARPIKTLLAPQARRRGRWLLRPMGGPAVVYAPITVTLAPSRRVRPFSILREPVFGAARAAIETTVRVTLAPSHRGRTLSLLRKPVVVRTAVELSGPEITLAPSRRGRPFSTTITPAVVGRDPFAPITVTLTRIRPRPTRVVLGAPVVVDSGEPPFFGPQVTLAPSKRGRTMWRLVLVEGNPAPDVCYGQVTGFDFAPAVCGDDSAATVSGSDTATQQVQGSDTSATVSGSDSGATVCGGDTQREGC